jgi:hypothetical protein
MGKRQNHFRSGLLVLIKYGNFIEEFGEYTERQELCFTDPSSLCAALKLNQSFSPKWKGGGRLNSVVVCVVATRPARRTVLQEGAAKTIGKPMPLKST